MMQAGRKQRCKMGDDKQRYKEANKKVEPQPKTKSSPKISFHIMRPTIPRTPVEDRGNKPLGYTEKANNVTHNERASRISTPPSNCRLRLCCVRC